MPEVIIRESHVKDIPSIVKIEELCFSKELRYGRPIIKVIIEYKNHYNSYTVIAVENEKQRIVGFGCYEIDFNDPTIGRIVTIEIHPTYQGYGFGQKLMIKLEFEMLKNGIAESQLHVLVSNTKAINFYQRLGYDKVKELRNYYSRGLNAFFMKKTLNRFK